MGSRTSWKEGEQWLQLTTTDIKRGSWRFSSGIDLAKDVRLHSWCFVEEPTSSSGSEDSNRVTWSDGEDAEHPYNWPAWKVNINLGLICCLAFISALATGICSPAIPQAMEEFGSNNSFLGVFLVSVYVLGLGIGPVIFGPLSEIYGRAIVYHVTNAGMVVFSLACAISPSLEALVAFRFLAGFFASSPMSLSCGGSVPDMVPPARRGFYVGLVTVGSLVAPLLGPVIGGFMTDALGWRWVFWFITIFAGILTAAMLVFSHETYAPVLLERKLKTLRRETGNLHLYSALDRGLSPLDRVKLATVRPAKLLLLSPIGLVCGIYMLLIYGYLYLMMSTIALTFESNYGFTASTSGLVFLGLGLGNAIGTFVSGAESDWRLKQRTKLKGQLQTESQEPEPATPESRLNLCPVGAILLPLGFFLYGWTLQYHVHWIVPVIALFFIGIGNMLVSLGLMLYLIDVFTLYAASALAGSAVIRGIGGAFIPLAGVKMYNVLGQGWGNSLLGFIATGLIPVPFLFARYGSWLRTKFEIKNL